MEQTQIFTPPTQRTAIPFWRQIRWNLVAYYIVLAVMPVAIVVAFTAIRTRDQIREQTIQHLESIAELKRGQITRWLDDGKVTLGLFLSEPERAERFKTFATATMQPDQDTASLQSEEQALSRLLLDAVRAQKFFREMFFYNTDGRIVASSIPEEVGKVVIGQPYFANSLVQDFIQTPYYAIGTEELTMLVTRPMFNASGRTVGVIAGRLDLGDLKEIMTERTGLGDTGETYLVSPESNYLVTPSLFEDEGYELTQAYHSQGIDQALEGKSDRGAYRNYRDPSVMVIGVYSWLGDLQVAMLAEKSESEALAPYVDALQASLALGALVALGFVGLGYLFARRLSNPIVALSEVAARIAGGDLEQRAHITRRNEIGLLATVFNSMTAQLQGLIGSLERRVIERTRELEASTADLAARRAELETAYQRQAEINRDLEQTIRQSRRRATLLQASAEVSRAITRITDIDQLLSEITRLISQSFGFYHAGVFMLDEAQRYAVLRAANSQGGQRMLERQHKLGVGAEGIVGYVTSTGQARIALDVGADAVHFTNPDLPDTRSEMALPLRSGEEIIGALDIQSTEEAAFEEEDVAVLTTMADQITIAIQNVRLLRQTRVALEEARQIQQRYFQREWAQYTQEREALGHEYTIQGVSPVGDATLEEMRQAWQKGEMIIADGDSAPAEQTPGSAPFRTALVAPIKVHDAVIGVLDLHEADAERVWGEDEVALVQAVADQVGQALQSARLFAATQQRARREELTRRITDRIRAASDIEDILQTAAEELGKALDVSRAVARLHTRAPSTSQDQTPPSQEESAL
jgi:GAF domain-containing protein/HAMP domain-containing protein